MGTVAKTDSELFQGPQQTPGFGAAFPITTHKQGTGECMREMMVHKSWWDFEEPI